MFNPADNVNSPTLNPAPIVPALATVTGLPSCLPQQGATRIDRHHARAAVAIDLEGAGLTVSFDTELAPNMP